MKTQVEQAKSFNALSSLTNLEMQKYYQNGPKFNGAYSINNLEKRLVLFVICSKCKIEDQKIFKEEDSIETLKILGLIEKISLL